MAKPTVQQWKRAGVHDVTLNSGFECQVRIPDIPRLIKAGEIPNELVEVSVKAAQGVLAIDRELLEQQADFAIKLVPLTVVEPKITEEDVASGNIPYEDIELIMELATRQRDVDAVGKHLGGLEKVASFRALRELPDVFEDVEGVSSGGEALSDPE